MRTTQDLVPLRPRLDDVAVGIGDDDAVLPLGVNTKLPIRRPLDPEDVVLPSHAVSHFRVLIGAAGARERSLRRVSPHPATGKLMLGPTCGNSVARGASIFGSSPRNSMKMRFGSRQTRLSRAVGPLFIPGQRADVLRPALDDLIRPGQILASDGTRHRRKASGRGRWRRCGSGALVIQLPAANTNDKRHEHRGNVRIVKPSFCLPSPSNEADNTPRK